MSSRDGLVLIDKPAGCTSHDVVARTRRLAGTRRVGHAGTLDPMATGVLVLGVGRATKLLGHLALRDKEYEATVRLGVATTTDDAEGEVLAARPARHLTEAEIGAAVRPLTGAIWQVPSSVSAIKVNGKRAYARVRAGEQVELAARPVTVSTFEVTHVRTVGDTGGDTARDAVDVDVRVVCSSGTYIRSLARDLGEALQVGGHLTALRRTRVGPYELAATATLEQLESDWTLLPLADAVAAAFPRWDVDAEAAGRLGHGVALDLPAGWCELGPVGVFGPDGAVLALVEQRGGAARPLVVFAPAGAQPASASPAAGSPAAQFRATPEQT